MIPPWVLLEKMESAAAQRVPRKRKILNWVRIIAPKGLLCRRALKIHVRPMCVCLSVCLSVCNTFWLRFTKGKCVLEHAFPPCVFDQKYQFWASFFMFWDTYFAPSALSWKDRRSKKWFKTLKSDHIFCSFRFELKGSGVQKVDQNIVRLTNKMAPSGPPSPGGVF